MDKIVLQKPFREIMSLALQIMNGEDRQLWLNIFCAVSKSFPFNKLSLLLSNHYWA